MARRSCAFVLSIAILLVPLLVLFPISHGSELEFVSLREGDSAAVCMDGTSSGYYWKTASSGEGRHHWIVYLQSGGWCWDADSCAERCNGSPDMCSSKDWESYMEFDGILSSSHDEMHASIRNANKVFVRYCTSDAHMGDAAAFGYQFRGGRVVQAVLSDLVNLHGLGASDSEQDLLIFGGGSAGARGAMVHLDYVPTMLGGPSKNVQVVGFLDSPYWLDMKPLNGVSFDGFGSQTKQVYSFINASHLGEDCIEAYNDSLRWRCILGEYRMPYVTSRYLMIAALHDSYQMWHNAEPSDPWSTEQLEYAEEFATRTADLLRPLASQQHAVFGHACHTHAESLWESGFFRHGAEDGSSVSDAMHSFLRLDTNSNAENRSLRWIDECRSLDCGRGCHRGDDPCQGVMRRDGAMAWRCGDGSLGTDAVDASGIANDDEILLLNGSTRLSVTVIVNAAVIALMASFSIVLE